MCGQSSKEIELGARPTVDPALVSEFGLDSFFSWTLALRITMCMHSPTSIALESTGNHVVTRHTHWVT